MIAPDPAPAAPRPAASRASRARGPPSRSEPRATATSRLRAGGAAGARKEAARRREGRGCRPDDRRAVGEPVVRARGARARPVVEDAAALRGWRRLPSRTLAATGGRRGRGRAWPVARNAVPGAPCVAAEAKPVERRFAARRGAGCRCARCRWTPEAATPAKRCAAGRGAVEGNAKRRPDGRPLPAARTRAGGAAGVRPVRPRPCGRLRAIATRQRRSATRGAHGLAAARCRAARVAPVCGTGAAPCAGRRRPAPAQPQTVAPQAVMAQLAVAIGKASDRRVEIRLDPPELGRVQIHLTPVDGGMQAMVLSDRPETHDLLRRHAEVLARELDAAGYDSVSLDFAAGHEARAATAAKRARWTGHRSRPSAGRPLPHAGYGTAAAPASPAGSTSASDPPCDKDAGHGDHPRPPGPPRRRRRRRRPKQPRTRPGQRPARSPAISRPS